MLIRQQLANDEKGGVLVEAAVMIPIMFVFVLGAVDFLFAFYQWNAATKAVQVGTRLAAVSSPVADGLSNLSSAVLSSSVLPGDPMPANAFTVTCLGTGVSTGTCTCSGTCTGFGSYSASAMKTIVFGREGSNSNSCPSPSTVSSSNNGMCHMFSRITPASVSVVYSQTGLGFAGRPGGPVPTITVSLQPNLPFQFYFLGWKFANINIPALTTTLTGEDLLSTWPPA